MTFSLSTILALWRREMIRFFRQIGRIAGAVGQPLLLWVIFSAGIGRTFQMKGPLPADMGYGEFFFPGMIVMVLLFTAIFSTISVIEDRKQGLLRTVLVAPVPRFTIAVGIGMGGVTVAMIQGGVLLLLTVTPFLPLDLTWLRLGYTLGVMGMIALGFTSMGFCMAWFFDSSQSYHGMMSFLLIPLWMLSGALFPIHNLPAWLDVIMRLNPLSYGLEAFRAGFYPEFQPPADLMIHSLTTDLFIFAAFTSIMVTVAAVVPHVHRTS